MILKLLETVKDIKTRTSDIIIRNTAIKETFTNEIKYLIHNFSREKFKILQYYFLRFGR